jgi:hypothetical protein
MIVLHDRIDVGFANLLVIELAVHVEVEVVVVTLSGGLLGSPHRQQRQCCPRASTRR